MRNREEAARNPPTVAAAAAATATKSRVRARRTVRNLKSRGQMRRRIASQWRLLDLVLLVNKRGGYLLVMKDEQTVTEERRNESRKLLPAAGEIRHVAAHQLLKYLMATVVSGPKRNLFQLQILWRMETVLQ
jgi:hypothetical protein